MREKVAFSSRIGDRWTFAIEFEGIGSPPKAWNEWWGSLWLWVDGNVAGRPSEFEMVMTAFDSLVESAQQTRAGPSAPLAPSVHGTRFFRDSRGLFSMAGKLYSFMPTRGSALSFGKKGRRLRRLSGLPGRSAAWSNEPSRSLRDLQLPRLGQIGN